MIKRLLLLFTFVALATIILANHQANYSEAPDVSNFQECLLVEHKIIETYPEQCVVVPGGETFYGPLY